MPTTLPRTDRAPVRPQLDEHGMPVLSAGAYQRVRALLHQATGIELGAGKRVLVQSRWASRMQALGLASLDAYVELLDQDSGADEQALAMELLTTNETYFYREAQHFDVLAAHASASATAAERYDVWCAASASGEEAYSLAMTLQRLHTGGQRVAWHLLASDISDRMLAVGRRGVYPEVRVSGLPGPLLRQFCLRGHGPAQGTVLIEQALRQRIQWANINLVMPLPDVGPFDAIFLRNVLIYFDRPTKQRVVQALARRLRPGGLLFVGLTDSLLGLTGGLRQVESGVYTPDGR